MKTSITAPEAFAKVFQKGKDKTAASTAQLRQDFPQGQWRKNNFLQRVKSNTFAI